MKEEIDNEIKKQLDLINPSIQDVYSSKEQEINDLINNQNKKTEELNTKKKMIIELLKEIDPNIEFNENMSLEELENIARQIEVK